MRTPNGQPIPLSPYAISVSLDWKGVRLYEEGDAEMTAAMQSGYPRFRFDNFYAALKDRYNAASHGRYIMLLPSERVARKCVSFVGQGDVRQANDGTWLALLPPGSEAVAKAFWQHTGQIVSGRQAFNILTGNKPVDAEFEKYAISLRIADLTAQAVEDVYLFPTGMAAFNAAYETATGEGRDGKTVQLGFPYVDSLKIQQKFGAGAVYVPYNDPADLCRLEDVLDRGGVSGVFCEIPGNPLLHTINLPRLRKILDKYDIPLIIDDTIGTFYNIDLKPFADIIVTSLTKSFSGGGDVMGGSLVINRESKFYDSLKTKLDSVYEDIFYPDDAIAMEKNSRDFTDRMKLFNVNGETVADFLHGHPAVESLYYPKYVDAGAYTDIRKPGGGYGSLLSVVLRDRGLTGIFFDAMEGEKGPSLGYNSYLSSPYTKLAHWNEREFAAENGIDWDLVRISAGLENPYDFIDSMKATLELP